MGTSTWSFRGKRFDAPDPVLEVVLSLVIEALDELPAAPSWWPELRQEWHELVTEEFGFGVVPDLDSALADDTRRELVLRAAERALARVRALGDPISGAALPGAPFERDQPAHLFVQPLRELIALLQP